MIIDLTYEIHDDMHKYPSDPKFKTLERITAKLPDGKVISGYSTHKMRSHHGTHIDAPAHKIANGKTIGQYSIANFINRCQLIDLVHLNIPDRKIKGITIQDLYGRVAPNIVLQRGVNSLIFNTGYLDRISSKTAEKRRKDVEKGFTFFTNEAAEYVASIPNLRIVGLDSFSFDRSGSNSESHLFFLSEDILLLETVANLAYLSSMIEDSIFTLVCAPILYQNNDAAQTRAYAIVGGELHG